MIRNRGIICFMLYPLCHAQEESIIHILKDCPFVRKFWLSIVVPQALVDFLNLNLPDWLKTNCLFSSHVQANGLPWYSLFSFAVWWLWKHRNRAVFKNSLANPKLHLSCIQVVREYFYCVSKTQRTKCNIAIQMRWFRPPLGWFKLNSDGVAPANPGKAGGSGLI